MYKIEVYDKVELNIFINMVQGFCL